MEGIKYKFIVDTGSAFSWVKPDKWQVQPTELSVRAVTRTELELLGTQNVIMTIGSFKCKYTSIVSDLGTPGHGILGEELLQLAGASVNLDAGYLRIGEHKLPLESRDGTVQALRCLVTKTG